MGAAAVVIVNDAITAARGKPLVRRRPSQVGGGTGDSRINPRCSLKCQLTHLVGACIPRTAALQAEAALRDSRAVLPANGPMARISPKSNFTAAISELVALENVTDIVFHVGKLCATYGLPIAISTVLLAGHIQNVAQQLSVASSRPTLFTICPLTITCLAGCGHNIRGHHNFIAHLSPPARILRSCAPATAYPQRKPWHRRGGVSMLFQKRVPSLPCTRVSDDHGDHLRRRAQLRRE